MSRKRKDNKHMKKFVAEMSKATDSALRNAKYELLDDMMGTKKKAQLISLEKRIEAIEDIQYDRDMAYLNEKEKEMMPINNVKVKVEGGSIMKKFAGLVLLAATAACIYYVKVNDIRFPDIVDMLADYGIEI